MATPCTVRTVILTSEVPSGTSMMSLRSMMSSLTNDAFITMGAHLRYAADRLFVSLGPIGGCPCECFTISQQSDISRMLTEQHFTTLLHNLLMIRNLLFF